MQSQVIIPKPSTRLDRDFFARDARTVAKDLLGRILVRDRPNRATLYSSLFKIAAWEGNKKQMAKETLYAPGTLLVLPRYAIKVLGVATSDIGVASCVTFLAADVYDRSGLREHIEGPGRLSEELEVSKEYDGVPIDFSPFWIGGEAADLDRITVTKPPKLSPKGCKGHYMYL